MEPEAIKRTSRRISNDPYGESAVLIATFTVSADFFQLLAEDYTPAQYELFYAADCLPEMYQGPGRFFAELPYVILGKNNRVAVIQRGGLDV